MVDALKRLIHRLAIEIHDCRGVTALEYGLIAALVAIAVVGTVTTFGTKLSTEFSYLAREV